MVRSGGSSASSSLSLSSPPLPQGHFHFRRRLLGCFSGRVARLSASSASRLRREPEGCQRESEGTRRCQKVSDGIRRRSQKVRAPPPPPTRMSPSRHASSCGRAVEGGAVERGVFPSVRHSPEPLLLLLTNLLLRLLPEPLLEQPPLALLLLPACARLGVLLLVEQPLVPARTHACAQGTQSQSRGISELWGEGKSIACAQHGVGALSAVGEQRQGHGGRAAAVGSREGHGGKAVEGGHEAPPPLLVLVDGLASSPCRLDLYEPLPPRRRLLRLLTLPLLLLCLPLRLALRSLRALATEAVLVL